MSRLSFRAGQGAPCVVRTASLAALVLSILVPTAPANGQTTADTARPIRRSGVVALGSYAEEALRGIQLTEGAPTAGFLFRSLSGLAPRLAGSDSALRWAPVLPTVAVVTNSLLPYSLNDGLLWAGRGTNVLASGGVRAEWKRVRLFLVPEVASSRNLDYPAPDDTLFPPYHTLANPRFFAPPAGRDSFASPFHSDRQSIDLPIRFGGRAFTTARLGQSALLADVGPVTVGASTENEWWGPGIHTALLLSNNAPGFPHAVLRTRRPVETRVGAFEARWIVGGLTESDYFDDDPTNDLRSLSLLGVTWQPRWERDLTVGAARAVFSGVSGWGDIFGNVGQVFADVGQPNTLPLEDPRVVPGRDQLVSLFFRWLAPADGFEVFGEWARSEMPKDLRDFLLQPSTTQAYTVGMQWMGDAGWRGGRPRVQTEFSFLQQDASFRHRQIGSWYTSRPVQHGYTNEGQVLGAAIGPGSSGQWVAVDWMSPRWQLGLHVNRIRWLEDVHSQINWGPSRGWCEHDVSLLSGGRAAVITPAGTFTARYSTGWRLNVFFENRSAGCYQDLGRDVRNETLSFGFTPDVRAGRWWKGWALGR